MSIVWEEVSGLHFYTLLTLRTSLIDGAKVALALGDSTAAERYETVATELTPSIHRFWSPTKEIVRVTLDHTAGRESTENAHVGDAEYGKKSELDAAVILAVLHAGRDSSWSALASGGSEEAESAEKILSTLRRLMDAMGTLYPLNAGRREKKEGVALGRYPEDEYDGVGLSIAHPWYLATSAAAEYLYLVITRLAESPGGDARGFTLTPLLHSTLTSILPALSPSLAPVGSTVSRTDATAIVEALFKLADSFLAVVQRYVGEQHRLDEQFERTGVARGSEKHADGEIEDGKRDGPVVGRGARELTWSHAALITAVQQRKIAKEAIGRA